MIHKLKNYLSGRWRGLVLLAIWLALSGVVLSMPRSGSQAQSRPSRENSPVSAVASESIRETGSDGSQTPPAAPQNNQPSTPTKKSTSSANHTSPAPKPAATVTVALNIEDDFAGNVILPAGSDHCDVLNVALQNNLISDVYMRYSPQHKSYGVYVINGVGDKETLGWTFKISGRSPPTPSPWVPPLGCSHIKAEQGDSVKWEYVN